MSHNQELFGTGRGHHGDIKVAVNIENDKIQAIKVVDHSETKGVSEPAFEKLLPPSSTTNHTQSMLSLGLR